MSEPISNKPTRTWFVTGAGKGLGAALVRQIISRGDHVVALVRSQSDAQTINALDKDAAGTALAVIGDVTDEKRVFDIVEELEANGQQIDIAVNNAGYGLLGATEEISSDELRAVFDVNVFGAFHVIKAVIPHMRKRRAGHIINVTSISGFAPWAGTSAYTASKYAIEGLGQTLHEEVKELGVNVTNIAPGALRTAFGTSSLRESEQLIEDYAATAHAPRESYRESGGKENGDPVKAADAIIDITRLANPPLHLFLGEDALKYLSFGHERIHREAEEYRDVTLSIAYSDTAPAADES